MTPNLDPANLGSARSWRRGSRPRRAGVAALAAAGVSALAMLPASHAAASESSSATVGVSTESPGASGSATVSVQNLNGKATELLHKLTTAQLASLLEATPEQALAPLVAGATETADQLRGVVSTALSDLGEDGGIAELAHELVMPPAVLEAPQLIATSVEKASESLGTDATHLSSALMGAGAAVAPLTAASPVTITPVERTESNDLSLIVASPTGAGGVSLTTVSATGATPGAVAGFQASSPASVSNAFTILSVKVTRAGAILEKVRLPGPGRVGVVASATKSLARKSAHARARTRRVKVASAAAATSGGTMTLTLHPRGVSGAKRTRVSLATTYAPKGGSPRTLTRYVTLGRAARRRHA